MKEIYHIYCKDIRSIVQEEKGVGIVKTYIFDISRNHYE